MPRTRKNADADLSSASSTPQIITVPSMHYLMIDGTGDPNRSAWYAECVSALFGASYGVKFFLKKNRGTDHRVSPLEGLWWTPEMKDFSVERKEEWYWTMVIRQPDSLSVDLWEEIRSTVMKKKPSAALEQLRFTSFAEGKCAQVMHRGPYADEGPTIAALHRFIAEHGHGLRDKHHEIYLSDPRRSAPEKMKTILRQPIL